jgi:hypothetical protein
VYGFNSKSLGDNGNSTLGKASMGNCPAGWGGYFIDKGYFSDKVGIGTLTPDEKLVVNGAIKLLGGGDIAEPFDIKEEDLVEPGMVVVIDPENPEKLKISDRAYDRCVAGIVSGAGGVKPGLMITQEDVFEGAYHVALAGRVYALCDASYDSIEPGDLLTTSPISGYAMKVIDYERAQGAILGKAMTRLKEGQGLVLVLVALQ